MVRSAGTAGTHDNHATPEGVSALCDPHERELSGAPWRADYVPFITIPNSLVIPRAAFATRDRGAMARSLRARRTDG